MLYARHDVQKVHVGDGGCGKTHERNPKAEHFTVTCAKCEAVLQSDPLWTNNLNKMPLSPDQELEKNKQAIEGTVLTQTLAKAMGEALANIIGKDPKAAQTALDGLRHRPTA